MLSLMVKGTPNSGNRSPASLRLLTARTCMSNSSRGTGVSADSRVGKSGDALKEKPDNVLGRGLSDIVELRQALEVQARTVGRWTH